MSANKIRHESKLARDHKILNLCVAVIRGGGSYGVKRGQLILQSGVPFAQWINYHQVLVDIEEIIWDKSSRTYMSVDGSKYPKPGDGGE